MEAHLLLVRQKDTFQEQQSPTESNPEASDEEVEHTGYMMQIERGLTSQTAEALGLSTPGKAMLKSVSMGDETSRDAFKGKVRIANWEGKVLIDSGATANFVAQHIVQRLQLPTTPLPTPLQVTYGGKNKGQITMMAEVDVQLGEVKQRLAFLVIPNTIDLTLGKQWMRQHRTQTDWDNDLLLFLHDGKQYHVPPLTHVDPQQLLDRRQCATALCEEGSTWMLACVEEEEARQRQRKDWKEEWKQKYPALFCDELPPGLPPAREVEHPIGRNSWQSTANQRDLPMFSDGAGGDEEAAGKAPQGRAHSSKRVAIWGTCHFHPKENGRTPYVHRLQSIECNHG